MSRLVVRYLLLDFKTKVHPVPFRRFEKSLIYYNQCINMRPTEHSFKAKYLAGRER